MTEYKNLKDAIEGIKLNLQKKREKRESDRKSLIKARLEYLREQIKAESISYDEIAELQSLADYIEPGDIELLEWAGVPEDNQ